VDVYVAGLKVLIHDIGGVENLENNTLSIIYGYVL
jgi:hypothetical protein